MPRAAARRARQAEAARSGWRTGRHPCRRGPRPHCWSAPWRAHPPRRAVRSVPAGPPGRRAASDAPISQVRSVLPLPAMVTRVRNGNCPARYLCNVGTARGGSSCSLCAGTMISTCTARGACAAVSSTRGHRGGARCGNGPSARRPARRDQMPDSRSCAPARRPVDEALGASPPAAARSALPSQRPGCASRLAPHLRPSPAGFREPFDGLPHWN